MSQFNYAAGAANPAAAYLGRVAMTPPLANLPPPKPTCTSCVDCKHCREFPRFYLSADTFADIVTNLGPIAGYGAKPQEPHVIASAFRMYYNILIEAQSNPANQLDEPHRELLAVMISEKAMVEERIEMYTQLYYNPDKPAEAQKPVGHFKIKSHDLVKIAENNIFTLALGAPLRWTVYLTALTVELGTQNPASFGPICGAATVIMQGYARTIALFQQLIVREGNNPARTKVYHFTLPDRAGLGTDVGPDKKLTARIQHPNWRKFGQVCKQFGPQLMIREMVKYAHLIPAGGSSAKLEPGYWMYANSKWRKLTDDEVKAADGYLELAAMIDVLSNMQQGRSVVKELLRNGGRDFVVRNPTLAGEYALLREHVLKCWATFSVGLSVKAGLPARFRG